MELKAKYRIRYDNDYQLWCLDRRFLTFFWGSLAHSNTYEGIRQKLLEVSKKKAKPSYYDERGNPVFRGLP